MTARPESYIISYWHTPITMTRPFKCRNIRSNPKAYYFKPRAVPVCELEETVLQLDEFEAMRLADLEGMEQETAAGKMSVSRQTFGNILASARRKVADAIVNGKALNIQGGIVKMQGRHFICYDCKNEWGAPHGTPRPEKCPKCASVNIHRAPSERGPVRAGFGRGRCRGRAK